MTAAHMNNYQRDTVKTVLPGFKTTSYKGKADKNLRTDGLAPGPYIESMRKGLVLPTFEDLVQGLQRLPSGLDARGLTQCLTWYLNIRHTFTPKLELNVLHTQSLIRALRQPLKPFGPQNLDRNALEEFRGKGTFETVGIENNAQLPGGNVPNMLALERSRMHLNLDDYSVSMDLTLPVRHVLTLPFIALHKVVEEALKFGIDKAENRREARTGDAAQKALEAKFAAGAAAQFDEEMEDGPDQGRSPTPAAVPEHEAPTRVAKRPLSIQADQLSSHKKTKPAVPTQPGVMWPTAAPTGLLVHPPTGPRAMTASYSSMPSHPTASHIPFTAPRRARYSNLTWHALTTTSAVAQPQQPLMNTYDNRNNQGRQTTGQHPTHQTSMFPLGDTHGGITQGTLPHSYARHRYGNVANNQNENMAHLGTSAAVQYDEHGEPFLRADNGVEYDLYGNMIQR